MNKILIPNSGNVQFRLKHYNWYIAGISDEKAKQYKIKVPSQTDNLTKENFRKLIPQKFKSKSQIDFMSEILKDFSIEKAKQRNKSFKYFIDKIR